MQIIKTVFFFILIFTFSCKNDPPSIKDPGTEKPEKNDPKPTKMIVNIDNLRIRAEPGDKGAEIGRLREGTVLYDLGEVSDFTTRVQLRGIWFEEPWLKVKTEQNLEGWVYGGAVKFDMDNPTDLAKKILNIRLQTFFGKGLTARLNRYKNNYDSLKTSKGFVKIFKEGLRLRDTLANTLENRINVSEGNSQMPDLFWIEEAFPGYVTQLVAEGTVYFLFIDFKQLQQKVSTTRGEEDDDFIGLNLLVYSADSVEYFYTSWFIQTWDYGGCSLLGQGEHLKVLKEIDRVLKKSDLFAKEITALKDRLMNDITNKDVDYWETKDKILDELDAIFAANISALSNEDLIALKTRSKQFEYPAENNIKLNFRSGEVN